MYLNSAKRLSIDIDIICPPGTQIEDYLKAYSAEYGFGNVELVERISRTDIPKKHAKYYYQVSYPAGGRQDKILLDVLFEENHYSKVVSLPIQSPFLKTEGEPVMVNLPSYQDMLGDKLTAFAPHTTGIPFFKGESEVRHFSSDKEQELIGAVITDLLPTKFNKFKKSNVEAFFYWYEIQKLIM